MKSPGRRGVTAIDKYIGHRLRTQRLILNMTQTDIAKVIGVTFQQLQKYEKGTNRITASTLQKLAAAMKVPITYFLKNAPCEHADQNDSEMAWTQLLATPDGLALFRAFRGIESKSLRRAVVNREVSQTLELISRHRNILADLGRKEVDAETIQIMLSQLEIQLVFQLQEREKLRAELTRHNG
jgi:transcriptional regulator with XRE-family HTH domain